MNPGPAMVTEENTSVLVWSSETINSAVARGLLLVAFEDVRARFVMKSPCDESLGTSISTGIVKISSGKRFFFTRVSTACERCVFRWFLIKIESDFSFFGNVANRLPSQESQEIIGIGFLFHAPD